MSNIIAIVFCILFAIIGVSADKSLVTTLHSIENYKNRNIYFNYESQKNGSLFYLFCDRSSTNEMPCTVFKEEHFEDHQPRLSICNVTLREREYFGRTTPNIRVLPINRVKTLILWASNGRGRAEDILKFVIVDFETCKITVTDVSVENHLRYMNANYIVKTTGLAFYDNSIDVSYHHETPGSHPFCRVRIDYNTGKIIREREYWYLEGRGAMEIIPKDPHDPDKGQFFFDYEEGKIYNWSDHSLLYFPTGNYHENWRKFRYSMRDHFITVCNEIEETKVKCDQIDYNGTITIHAVFDLTKKNIAPVPYTLLGGGFLLLTTECISNCTEGTTYHVMKVDIRGQQGKSIEINGFNCDVNKLKHWHTFFEDEKGNICVSLLCYKWENKNAYPEFPVWDEYFGTPQDLRIQCLNQTIF